MRPTHVKISVTLLVMVMKLLIKKIYIGKEGFISDHSLRIQTIMAGRAQEHRQLEEKQRDGSCSHLHRVEIENRKQAQAVTLKAHTSGTHFLPFLPSLLKVAQMAPLRRH